MKELATLFAKQIDLLAEISSLRELCAQSHAALHISLHRREHHEYYSADATQELIRGYSEKINNLQKEFQKNQEDAARLISQIR